jgi:hypothetical protein
MMSPLLSLPRIFPARNSLPANIEAVGYTDSVDVGAEVGVNVGNTVGALVGLLVLLGASETDGGLIGVGAADASVGNELGLEEGHPDGSEDG